MIDYFLRFPDEETANSVLFDEERPLYSNIDVIGTIYKPTGEVVDQGDIEVPVVAAIEGWHVNVRHDKASTKLKKYAIQPTNPVRVWA